MKDKKMQKVTEAELENASPERLKHMVRQYSAIAVLASNLYEDQCDKIKTLEFFQGFRFN